MTDLLKLLMSGNTTPEKIKSASNDLSDDVEVKLEGVNAPEFGEESPFDMEEAYQSQKKSSISIPTHDDGLDDVEVEMTSDHVFPIEDEDTSVAAEEILDEDGEPVDWNRKPFESSYFNFGGRTVNALVRAGYTCFDDIRGMSHSELKALRGFGAKCLDEVVDLLIAERQSDWLVKRKKAKPEIAEPKIAEPVVAKPVVAEPVAAEPVVAEPVVAEPVAAEPVAAEPVVAEPVVAEPVAAEPAKLKVLVVGGSAAPMRQGMRVANFEQVYLEAIRMICEQASSPSLASVEYGKGWSALGATIRSNGWPDGVDVLTVSKSYMGRPEVLMELRFLADLVIEA